LIKCPLLEKNKILIKKLKEGKKLGGNMKKLAKNPFLLSSF